MAVDKKIQGSKIRLIFENLIFAQGDFAFEIYS